MVDFPASAAVVVLPLDEQDAMTDSAPLCNTVDVCPWFMTIPPVRCNWLLDTNELADWPPSSLAFLAFGTVPSFFTFTCLPVIVWFFNRFPDSERFLIRESPLTR